MGRAGARGGAGAERGGNDCNLVKSTKSLGTFMKITKKQLRHIIKEELGTVLKTMDEAGMAAEMKQYPPKKPMRPEIADLLDRYPED